MFSTVLHKEEEFMSVASLRRPIRVGMRQSVSEVRLPLGRGRILQSEGPDFPATQIVIVDNGKLFRFPTTRISFYVLSGCGKIKSDGSIDEVRPGSFFTIPEDLGFEFDCGTSQLEVLATMISCHDSRAVTCGW